MSIFNTYIKYDTAKRNMAYKSTEYGVQIDGMWRTNRTTSESLTIKTVNSYFCFCKYVNI